MTVLCTRTINIRSPYKPFDCGIQRVKVDGTVESCTQARRDRPEPPELQFEEPEPGLFRRCRQVYRYGPWGEPILVQGSWDVFELWYEES